MEMINGKLLKDMLASGANNLSNKFKIKPKKAPAMVKPKVKGKRSTI